MAVTPKSDEQLLTDFTGGRRAALGELARRHETAFLGLAAGLLSGRNDLAMDAVQEAWLRVIRFGHRFNGRSSFKTWAYRIVVNQCRDLARMNGALCISENAGQGRRQFTVDPPDKAAETDERDRQLRETVDALNPEKREVVLLCYHKGLTHAEAAEVLEIPIGTLKSRLHSALTELRRHLGSEAKDA